MGAAVMINKKSFESTQSDRKQNIELFFDLYPNKKSMAHLKFLLTNYLDFKTERDIATSEIKGEKE